MHIYKSGTINYHIVIDYIITVYYLFIFSRLIDQNQNQGVPTLERQVIFFF